MLGLGLPSIATGLDFEHGALGHLRILIAVIFRAKGKMWKIGWGEIEKILDGSRDKGLVVTGNR